jgi:hypothetical protein
MAKITISKRIEVSEELDEKIKDAVTLESMIQSRTVTESEMIIKWISEGASKPRTQKSY